MAAHVATRAYLADHTVSCGAAPAAAARLDVLDAVGEQTDDESISPGSGGFDTNSAPGATSPCASTVSASHPKGNDDTGVVDLGQDDSKVRGIGRQAADGVGVEVVDSPGSPDGA